MLALLTILALLRGVSSSIQDCGAGQALFTITELRQDPNAIVAAGQNLSLTLKYTNAELITAGTATSSITLNYIPFTPTVEDLCTKVPCPLEPGEHDGSSWSLFPSGVSGSLVSKVEWHDSSDRLLLCIKSSLSASGTDKNDTLTWVARR